MIRLLARFAGRQCRQCYNHRLQSRRLLHPTGFVAYAAKLEITPPVQRHLETLLTRHKELQTKLASVDVSTLPAQEFIQLNKDVAALTELVEAYDTRRRLTQVKTQSVVCSDCFF